MQVTKHCLCCEILSSYPETFTHFFNIGNLEKNISNLKDSGDVMSCFHVY